MVDGELFCAVEGFRLRPHENAVLGGSSDRLIDRIEARRKKLPHLVEEGTRLEQENARIPEEPAAREILGGLVGVRLLHKASNRKRGVGRSLAGARRFDIAI